MNLAEVGEVIAAVQIFDNRKADEATIKTWHKVLSRYTLEDCLDAVVAHYTESTEWLMPAHIIRFVKRRRARRIELAGNPVLHFEDEYDDDNTRRDNADQLQRRLVEMIANGQLTAEQYNQYRCHDIALESLFMEAKPLT